MKKKIIKMINVTKDWKGKILNFFFFFLPYVTFSLNYLNRNQNV